jgi:hypothetical protein
MGTQSKSTAPEAQDLEQQALHEVFTAQRRRSIQATDDGRLDVFQQHKNVNEEGVLQAFKRWEVSEQARLKHKQPDLDAEVPTQLHELPSVTQTRFPNHVRRMKRDKGPVFEKVDGAVLDAKPAATGPFGQEMTIPEMEAKDVREIQNDLTEDESFQSANIEDYSTLSSLSALLSMTSASSSSGMSFQFSSASPNESSPTSTQSSTPSPHRSVLQGSSALGKLPYKHVPVNYMPSPVKDGNVTYALNTEYARASKENLKDNTDILSAEAGTATIELPAHNAKTSTQQHATPLAAIQEEQGAAPTLRSAMDVDGTPAPAVKGVSDEEVVYPSKLSSLKERIINTSHSRPSIVGDTNPPQPPLIAARSEYDENIDELEASSIPSPADPHHNPTQKSSSQANGDGHGALSRLGLGVSKASHAIHAKVKKTVTFNNVDDVRLMTPSPQRLSLTLEEQATA